MKYGRKILPNHPDLVNLMILREREKESHLFERIPNYFNEINVYN